MGHKPDMIIQFARYLDDLVKENADFDPIVTAKIKVGLNGRDQEPFFSEHIDLSILPINLSNQYWLNKGPLNLP